MKKLIAYTFVALSPIVFGIFVCMGISAYFNLHGDQMTFLLGGYSAVWMVLFFTWFDGSEYQNQL